MMIQTREWQIKHAPNLSPTDYLLVKVDNLRFMEDKIRLGFAIDIIGLCNALNMVDEIFKKLNSPRRVDAISFIRQ